MARIETEREAKEYLIGRIVAAAKREGVTLSETERQMLYFSESGWTLPGMLAVNEQFESNYDENEYEQKIAGLVRNIQEFDEANGGSEQETWDDAVIKLSKGDHYLLALIDGARSPTLAGNGFIPTFQANVPRPPHDRLKLWLTAFAIVFASFAFLGLGNWLLGSRFQIVTDWLFDRDRRGLLFLIGFLIWLFWAKSGARLRETINLFLRRR